MDNKSTLTRLFMVLLSEWKLLLFVSLLFLIYFHYTSTFDYFKKRNIKYMQPTIIFGNILDRFFCKKSHILFQLDIYNFFKGQPYGGLFEGRKPVLYVLDPELIKAITIRDSDHFQDRVRIETKEPRYLSRSIINLKGSEWKAVRSLLTPTFSSGRLKNMFPLIQQCTSQLVSFLDKYDNTDVDIKDVMVHLTLEITGVCAFGISTNTLEDENAKFKKVAIEFNSMSTPKRILIFGILLFAPSLFKYLNVSFLNYDAVTKLLDILKKTKANRMINGFRRNDFLQLLIDASIKEKEDIAVNKAHFHLDDDTVDAQALIFLIAGFETTSTELSFAIYEMAVHADIQEKLRSHIEEVTKNEELNYDHLARLDYLEAFITETLRMYPTLARVTRECTKPYTLPGTSVQLKVGDNVAISVYGIHMDPEIYPDPETFKPERFMPDVKNKTPSHLFLTFGSGPRNCIGGRFAMVVMKTTIVTLLRNFRFSMCSKTEVPVVFDRRHFLLKAENGPWVHIDKI